MYVVYEWATNHISSKFGGKGGKKLFIILSPIKEYHYTTIYISIIIIKKCDFNFYTALYKNFKYSQYQDFAAWSLLIYFICMTNHNKRSREASS